MSHLLTQTTLSSYQRFPDGDLWTFPRSLVIYLDQILKDLSFLSLDIHFFSSLAAPTYEGLEPRRCLGADREVPRTPHGCFVVLLRRETETRTVLVGWFLRVPNAFVHRTTTIKKHVDSGFLGSLV